MITIVETTGTKYGASERFVLMRKTERIESTVLMLIPDAPLVGYVTWREGQEETYAPASLLLYGLSGNNLKKISSGEDVAYRGMRACYEMMSAACGRFNLEFPASKFPLDEVIKAFDARLNLVH